MKFAPVRSLVVSYEPVESRRETVGRLGTKSGEVFFEYDPKFLSRGLELSPFRLPLRPGVFQGDRALWEGLMGLFEDSLPDGWGRLLMNRRAAQAGLRADALGPLDRLAMVGGRSMGALVYEPEVELEPPTVISLPEIAAEVETVLAGARGADLEKLIALGGSPQGARPKALVQVSKDGAVICGSRRTVPGWTQYLVKFRARDDELHAGTLEHAYMRMAAAAGIDVPETTLLGRNGRHPGYFAIRRFDRDGPRKIHLHTLSGLLHAPHTLPSVTYRVLLLATRELTGKESAVVEVFRRACFNVLAHNRDDHPRNFAFLMDEDGQWRPSPAYDLTFSAGPGGEHSMLIGEAGAHPTREDLFELAHLVDLKRYQPVYERVREAVARFTGFADDAGVPSKVARPVAKVLAATAGTAPSRRRR
ncbi:MAG: type II toxin-antitoxin system HipA family toxin [Myxococcales bacterium]